MTEATSAAAASPSPFAGGDWFDPLEEAVRRQVRAFIEELLEEEDPVRPATPAPDARAAGRLPPPGLLPCARSGTARPRSPPCAGTWASR